METTKEAKEKARAWWNLFTDREKLEISLKYYGILDLSNDQVVSFWRRRTGGEWMC